MGGTTTIIEEDDAESTDLQVRNFTAEVKEDLVLAKDLPIQGAADLELAGAVLQDVKKRRKALTTLKETVTRPLMDALEAARALFRPAESALAETESVIKTKVAKYDQEQKQKALDAARALREAETSAQASAALAARAQAEVKAPKGVTLTKVWKFEVTDPDLVPRQFLEVNDMAIRRAVAEGAREIPGVRVYEDTQVAVRTK